SGRERLDAELKSCASCRRADFHWHGLGELLAGARPARPVRRDEGKRRRPRRRRGGVAILHRGEEHLHSEIDRTTKCCARRAVVSAKAGFFAEPKKCLRRKVVLKQVDG